MPLLSAHCDLQRTAPAHQGQFTGAQSDSEDCEQDLHKQCGSVLPYYLNFFIRYWLCQTVASLGGR